MSVYTWLAECATKHHCDVCSVPLSNPRNLIKCIGQHVEICPAFHQQFFRIGFAHDCRPCRSSAEIHHQRLVVMVNMLSDIQKLVDAEADARGAPERKTREVALPKLSDLAIVAHNRDASPSPPPKSSAGIIDTPPPSEASDDRSWDELADEEATDDAAAHQRKDSEASEAKDTAPHDVGAMNAGVTARVEKLSLILTFKEPKGWLTGNDLDETMRIAYMFPNKHGAAKRAAEARLRKYTPNFEEEARRMADTVISAEFGQSAILPRSTSKVVKQLQDKIAAHLMAVFNMSRETCKRRVAYDIYITKFAHLRMIENQEGRNVATGDRNLDKNRILDEQAIAGAQPDPCLCPPDDLRVPNVPSPANGKSTPFDRGIVRDDRIGGTPIRRDFDDGYFFGSTGKNSSGYRKDNGAITITSGNGLASREFKNLRSLQMTLHVPGQTPSSPSPNPWAARHGPVADMIAADDEAEAESAETIKPSALPSPRFDITVGAAEEQDAVAGAEANRRGSTFTSDLFGEDVPRMLADTRAGKELAAAQRPTMHAETSTPTKKTLKLNTAIDKAPTLASSTAAATPAKVLKITNTERLSQAEWRGGWQIAGKKAKLPAGRKRK